MQNNSLIIAENLPPQKAAQNEYWRAFADFGKIEKIRENFDALSVEFVRHFTELTKDKDRVRTRQNTARQYLKGPTAYFAFNPDGEIDEQSAHDWAASLADKELTTQTALVGGCRRFFDWAIRKLKSEMGNFAKGNMGSRLPAQLIQIENPFVGLKLDKVEKLHRRDELGEAGAKRFERYLDSIATDSDGKTTRLMCLLELKAGCRSIELARLTVGDVRRGLDDETPHIFLLRKGRQSKCAHAVRSSLVPLLREAIEGRADKEPLFMSQSNRSKGKPWNVKSIENRIRDAIEGAGLKSERITPHSLRHTNVNDLLRAGVSIEAVAGYEDHKSTTTTMIYAHHIHELDAQRDALAQLEAAETASKPRRGRPKGSKNKPKASKARRGGK